MNGVYGDVNSIQSRLFELRDKPLRRKSQIVIIKETMDFIAELTDQIRTLTKIANAPKTPASTDAAIVIEVQERFRRENGCYGYFSPIHQPFKTAYREGKRWLIRFENFDAFSEFYFSCCKEMIPGKHNRVLVYEN